jgi:hypothetical protein
LRTPDDSESAPEIPPPYSPIAPEEEQLTHFTPPAYCPIIPPPARLIFPVEWQFSKIVLEEVVSFPK